MLALEVHIRLAHSGSLKDKRQVVRSLLDGSRARFGVAAAEVGRLGSHRDASLGFAAVSGSAGHAEEVISSVESFVWANPAIEVVSCERTWLEP